jgi:hypothetical protein
MSQNQNRKPSVEQGMRIYFTEYGSEGVKYTSSFFASSTKEAKELIRTRGLKESITGSNEIDKSNFSNLLHTVCFHSYIALKSGKASVDMILGDRGVLHEAIHILCGAYDGNAKNFNNKLTKLFSLTQFPV